MHSLEKSQKYAQNAFERIQKENLSPTPENYELWYVFYTGENPEIGHAIEVLEQGKAKITDQQCHELYQRFLSDNAENEKVREAGDKIQSTIKEVKGIVSNVKKSTAQYGTRLSGLSDRLGDGSISQEEIEVVLQDVVSNTREMVKQNELLEEKLVQSSKAMMEMQRDLEMVRKEALTDSLTSLANRKCFDAEMYRIIRTAKEEKTTFSLLMMDIDHFKSFNDNYGHQVGDQVLRLVAKTLKDGVKGRDIVSRFGGEEFAIILPETNLQGAVKVGDYLRKAVESKDVINRNTGEKLGRITMSGGVAEFLPVETSEDIIGRADAALYTAKHNGRNQIAAAPAPGQKRAVI